MTGIVFPRIERRTAAFDDLEVRVEGGRRVFNGLAAVFDRWSEDLGGFRERIANGAFRKLLARGGYDVRFLVDHDPSKIVGRTSVPDGPGSAVLSEEARGLRVRAVLSESDDGRNLATKVDEGLVTQMSFAWPYGAARDTIVEEDDRIERTIHEFTSLRDVSAVTFPAYPQTTAAIRSLEIGTDLREPELRELAEQIHRGLVFATEEERTLVDAAFAKLEQLSPWMEELARRALGLAAAGPADQETEGSGSAVATVGEPAGSPAAARIRRLSLRTHQLTGATR